MRNSFFQETRFNKNWSLEDMKSKKKIIFSHFSNNFKIIFFDHIPKNNVLFRKNDLLEEFQQNFHFFSTCGENNHSLFAFFRYILQQTLYYFSIIFKYTLFIISLFFYLILILYFFIIFLFSNETLGEKKNVDINCLFMWRAIINLPLWRVIVAFRLYRKPLKGLLEYKFYDLALYTWKKESNQELIRDDLRVKSTSGKKKKEIKYYKIYTEKNSDIKLNLFPYLSPTVLSLHTLRGQ